jgi:hypothetical protein
MEAEARALGASIVHLDLSDVRDRSQLVERLAQVFLFPHEVRGLDAVIDMLSDLEWLGAPAYLVIADGLDAAPGEVSADFSGVLPAIIDRWRTQRIFFVVALIGSEHKREIESALDHTNFQLDEAGKLPWAQPGTGGAPVIDHESHVE